MKFVCNEHNEVEPVEVDGYVLGHETERGEPNELDLEGVKFNFTTDKKEI